MGLSDLLLLILGKYDNKNNRYENKLSTVIHNWHKMWRENVAFDNTFITKKSLKLHLNLSWFKLYTISPKKRHFIPADTYSPWKDTFKPPSWKAICDRVRIWKHLPWIFPFSWLVFVIGFNYNTISFFIFISFMWFSSKLWQKTRK